MPGHFDAIGFPVDDREGLDELASLAAHKGQAQTVSGGFYIRFGFGDGPELWVQANTNRQIVGCNPHFAGAGALRAQVNQLIAHPRSPLDGAMRATAIDADGAEYPFQCNLPDFAAAAATVKTGAKIRLQIAAFAEQLQVFADAEEFRKSQSPSMSLAAESFIPAGLFSRPGKEDAPTRSKAMFTGTVLKSEFRSNKLTTVPYQYILVRSLGGTFDVVAEPAALKGVPPGSGMIVQAACWLSARVF